MADADKSLSHEEVKHIPRRHGRWSPEDDERFDLMEEGRKRMEVDLWEIPWTYPGVSSVTLIRQNMPKNGIALISFLSFLWVVYRPVLAVVLSEASIVSNQDPIVHCHEDCLICELGVIEPISR